MVWVSMWWWFQERTHILLLSSILDWPANYIFTSMLFIFKSLLSAVYAKWKLFRTKCEEWGGENVLNYSCNCTFLRRVYLSKSRGKLFYVKVRTPAESRIKQKFLKSWTPQKSAHTWTFFSLFCAAAPASHRPGVTIFCALPLPSSAHPSLYAI